MELKASVKSTNAPAQDETLRHSLERTIAGIGLHVKAHKNEYMYFNQRDDISKLNGRSLKLLSSYIYM